MRNPLAPTWQEGGTHPGVPMARFYPQLNDDLCAFIAQQHVFFTATAPSRGRINLSPKGMDTFRCLGPTTVAYLDLTGSGNETGAHLREDGRLTIMFCSFAERPLILRLYGRGRVVARGGAEWSEFAAGFVELPGTRQIIILDIDSVQTSCGFGVPRYAFEGERPTLTAWAASKGEDELRRYREKNNSRSIDGLPGGQIDNK